MVQRSYGPASWLSTSGYPCMHGLSLARPVIPGESHTSMNGSIKDFGFCPWSHPQLRFKSVVLPCRISASNSASPACLLVHGSSEWEISISRVCWQATTGISLVDHTYQGSSFFTRYSLCHWVRSRLVLMGRKISMRSSTSFWYCSPVVPLLGSPSKTDVMLPVDFLLISHDSLRISSWKTNCLASAWVTVTRAWLGCKFSSSSSGPNQSTLLPVSCCTMLLLGYGFSNANLYLG